MSNSNNISQVMKQMESFALKRWKTTEMYIEQFAKDAEGNMKEKAPGPETGTLDKSIKAEFLPTGGFGAVVRTKIEDNKYSGREWSAAQVGFFWEYGHYNIFLRRSVPPWHFMEGGSMEAYKALKVKLNALWR